MYLTLYYVRIVNTCVVSTYTVKVNPHTDTMYKRGTKKNISEQEEKNRYFHLRYGLLILLWFLCL